MSFVQNSARPLSPSNVDWEAAHIGATCIDAVWRSMQRCPQIGLGKCMSSL